MNVHFTHSTHKGLWDATHVLLCQQSACTRIHELTCVYIHTMCILDWFLYLKLLGHDIGTAPLKSNGKLHSNGQSKAEIFNRQFESVFNKDSSPTTMPMPSGPSFLEIGDLFVTVKGVEKLLLNINTSKAKGPDDIPNMFLKGLAPEIAPVVQFIFNQSLETGSLPSDWRDARVSPIFKKGDKHSASNYRPVSLTCICMKLLEHIIVKHLMSHYEKHSILSDLNHGFRSGFSCETQLLNTINDFYQSFDTNTQVDVAFLDFSKAFDVVPHDRLMIKLHHYGVRGKLHRWISGFLQQWTQSVVVDGCTSSPVNVSSGVPQGTCLGPILFLTFINDISHGVTSKTRLFADDCLLYRPITHFRITLTCKKTWLSLRNGQRCGGCPLTHRNVMLSVSTAKQSLISINFTSCVGWYWSINKTTHI